MWTVTRQIQWPDGIKMVEVSAGDFNYCNPGMLTVKWSILGEGKEFTDPREAVDAAIQIAGVWRNLNSASEPDEIMIGHGATGGMTMPFSSSTEEEMQKWADKVWETIPKCAHCGEALGKKKYHHELSFDNEEFCSAHCCEENYNNLENSLDEDE